MEPGKEWVQAWPRNPRRLRIGKRDFLGRLVSIAAFTCTASISTTVLIAAGDI